MGGIQMQYAPSGYIGLWSRMRGFDRPMLTRALEHRVVVQATLLRGTIHTVSAEDFWPMLVAVRRINREWYARIAAKELAGIDMDAAASATREVLAAGPLRMADLVAALEARRVSATAAKRIGFWVDLVRVPPSGTWEGRRADLYALAEDWLPTVEVDEAEGMRHLVRRYLGAFGPAPVRDVASWMGMNVGQIRDAVAGIELRTLRDGEGRTLLDLPDAPLPDPETPAPPRFIGTWEAMLLVHARRTDVLPEAFRPRVFHVRLPHSMNTFLVDGQVAGSWRFEAGEIRLDPFRDLTAAERASVEEEAGRLAAFHR
jgi:Winged helix DNA-binding domain